MQKVDSLAVVMVVKKVEHLVVQKVDLMAGALVVHWVVKKDKLMVEMKVAHWAWRMVVWRVDQSEQLMADPLELYLVVMKVD